MNTSRIVEATLSEMRYLIDSAKREGWNPGLHDSIPYYFTDPTGFFIEKLKEEAIGCISAVSYNDSYGFIGFYIVAPKFRHQGYGIRLWNHAIAYLGNRTIGLDGVVAEQGNYQKSGFKLHYNNIRLGAIAKGILSTGLQSLDMVRFKSLLEYDAKIVGFHRPSFLSHWMTLPNSYSLAKVKDNELLGYGLIRKCDNGYKVGPLFADDSTVANEIYLGLAAAIQGQNIFLDVPEPNLDAVNLAKELGLKKVFETARMYKGQAPKQSLEKIFGVTSFELG